MSQAKGTAADRYGEQLEQKGLGDAYRESLTDPELLQLRQEISLLDVRIRQLVDMIDGEVIYDDDVLEDVKLRFPHVASNTQKKIADYVVGYLPKNFIDYRTFGRLLALTERYEEALLSRRIRDADEALRLLFTHIREGRKSAEIWQDIQDAMERRRKLIETETKRMAMNDQLIPVDKVIILLGQTIESLKEAVLRYVQDKEVQSFILAEAQRTYQRNVFGPASGGDGNERIVDIPRNG